MAALFIDFHERTFSRMISGKVDPRLIDETISDRDVSYEGFAREVGASRRRSNVRRRSPML